MKDSISASKHSKSMHDKYSKGKLKCVPYNPYPVNHPRYR